jgi:hypothetical protein
MNFIIPQPALENLLEENIWRTRAWTMQEELFSKKELIFVGGLVYYRCMVSTWSEDTVEGKRNHLPANPQAENKSSRPETYSGRKLPTAYSLSFGTSIPSTLSNTTVEPAHKDML